MHDRFYDVTVRMQTTTSACFSMGNRKLVREKSENLRNFYRCITAHKKYSRKFAQLKVM